MEESDATTLRIRVSSVIEDQRKTKDYDERLSEYRRIVGNFGKALILLAIDSALSTDTGLPNSILITDINIPGDVVEIENGSTQIKETAVAKKITYLANQEVSNGQKATMEIVEVVSEKAENKSNADSPCHYRFFHSIAHYLKRVGQKMTKDEDDDVSNEHPVKRFASKLKGQKRNRAKIDGWDALASLFCSFLGMISLTSLDYFYVEPTGDKTLLAGSFAASAVLLFAAFGSPLAQPRNLILGHFLSSIVGVSMQILLGHSHKWLAGALAVALSIYLMYLTDSLHPPGGATAFIAVYSDQKIHNSLYWFVLMPVTAGAILLLLVALVVNNLFPWRTYPKHWY